MRPLTAAFAVVSAFLMFLAPLVDSLTGTQVNSPWEAVDYTLTYGLEVVNLGNASASKATAKIALMRDFLPVQDVSSTEPLAPGGEFSVDSWNNTYVLYRLSPVLPGETRTFFMRTTVRLNAIDFVCQDGTLPLMKVPQFAPYLAPEPFIESDDIDVVERAQQLGAGVPLAHEYALKAFQYTATHLNFVKQPEERGAAFALRSRTGQAAEYADLYAALMRVRGIPTGRLNGFAGDLQQGVLYFGEDLSHHWTRSYYEGIGWVPSDPTWGDRQTFENFEKSDGMHLVVTEGVGRKASFFVWNRTANPGANLHWDYHVQVESKAVHNLSLSRTLVFASFFGLPLGLLATIAFGWRREAKHRRRSGAPPPPDETEDGF